MKPLAAPALLRHGAFSVPGRGALAALAVCAVMLAAPGCHGTKETREQAIQGNSQKLREAVSSNVADAGRKTRMLAVVDQIEAVQTRLGKQTGDFIGSFRKLSADYSAPRPAFEQLFTDYNGRLNQARNQALDLHFQLASLATTSEWDPIGDAEMNLYRQVGASRPEVGTAP